MNARSDIDWSPIAGRKPADLIRDFAVFFLPQTIVALSVSALAPLPLFAQKISVDRVAQESGLSQMQVQSIVQDRQGFMWFGTLDGLNRYDGYQAKVIKHRPGDSTSLPGNDISALCI